MKHFVLPYCLLILFLSCRQNNSLVQDIEANTSTQVKTAESSIYKEYIFDTSKIAIIPPTSNFDFVNKLKLTNIDLRETDSLLTLALIEYNGTGKFVQTSYSINIEKYKRQYTPYINSKGDKIISIQGICEEFIDSDDWKKRLLEIYDGGKCVFGLTINLTKKTYDKIRIHGIA